MSEKKIYVALMTDGSERYIIHCISSDPQVCLAVLQKSFLEWRGSDEDEMEGIVDPKHPTLAEIRSRAMCDIVEIPDGAKLYEQLRDHSFEPGRWIEDLATGQTDDITYLTLGGSG